MSNILNYILHPQYKHEILLEVLRDFRKGGLTPENYQDFLDTIELLPRVTDRTTTDLQIFQKFNLIDITQEDFSVVLNEVMRRCVALSKKCWHPQASNSECNTDADGRIVVSAAHSIQNNGILSSIADNGHVMSHKFDKGEIEGIQLGKKLASIFWGFCNKHDAIFRPIEIYPYTGSLEQNFLFAYRAGVVSFHKKYETSHIIDYGHQWDVDIQSNLSIFHSAILSRDYSLIETDIFELDSFYPIAVSSAFFLDYDFYGNKILHSEDRMEFVYMTFIPNGNKSVCLISYFKKDKSLYENFVNQLRIRNNLKLDISVLIAAHAENVYFNPIYYKTFIEELEPLLKAITLDSQYVFARLNEDGEVIEEENITPSDYLQNTYGLNLFGY